MKTNYTNPEITVISLFDEGVLCASEPGAMKLPDVNWNDETEW